MIDKTKSAVGQLRETNPSCDIAALLDRVMDVPVDADGELLHLGDEVQWLAHNTVKIECLSVENDGWIAEMDFGGQQLCSELHKVIPDSQERIDADARKLTCEYFNHPSAECDDCPVHNDLTPCRALATIDLFRRQRELYKEGEQA